MADLKVLIDNFREIPRRQHAHAVRRYNWCAGFAPEELRPDEKEN